MSADNIPAIGISVYAVPEKGHHEGVKFPAKTDEFGRFRLDNVRAGPSMIYAYNSSDGYLDPSFAFYSGNKPSATVTVVPGGVARVQVRLGPKCAYLTGAILSSKDEKPISAAIFKLRRIDDPNIWLSTDPADNTGHFRIGVPPDTAFQLEIIADGFQPWELNVNGLHTSKGAPILQPGQEYSMKVQLQPISESPHSVHP